MLYRKSLTTQHLGHIAHEKGTPGHKPSTTDALWLTLPYPSPAERYYNLPLDSSETGGASAPARLSPAELAVTSRMGFRRSISGHCRQTLLIQARNLCYIYNQAKKNRLRPPLGRLHVLGESSSPSEPTDLCSYSRVTGPFKNNSGDNCQTTVPPVL